MHAMTPNNSLVQRFADLLAEYQSLRPKRESPAPKGSPSSFTDTVDELLFGYQTCHDAWARGQKKLAEGFNVLEVMGVDSKELCHSRLLEWLLARGIDQGTHAQGDLCFRLFLEEIGLNSTYANEAYWVRREVAGRKSRIDIEIAVSRVFIIHIENKIYASESKNETQREWEDLQARAEELVIPKKARHAIFMTLDGSAAEDEKHFISFSWSRMARVLDKFAEKAEALEVVLFARHYAKALRRLTAVYTMVEEIENGEATVQ